MEAPVIYAARLAARDVRRIAVRADVDPRTVLGRWRGSRQSAAIVAVIDRAARELGFEPPPAAQQHPAP